MTSSFAPVHQYFGIAAFQSMPGMANSNVQLEAHILCETQSALSGMEKEAPSPCWSLIAQHHTTGGVMLCTLSHSHNVSPKPTSCLRPRISTCLGLSPCLRKIVTPRDD